MPALPIDSLLAEIAASLRRSPNLVIEAPPGAGKTTRVPPALLDIARKQIIVLEPRRIAARMAARRVAQELGERLGETVGYQVRFEEVAGPRTRLLFATEGVLTRRLFSARGLAGVDLVVLDEFHERHLDTDLALAENGNLIVGHSHFMKTVEDLFEAIVNTVPQMKFGIAFNEASGPCLIRVDGNDEDLKSNAARNAAAVGPATCSSSPCATGSRSTCWAAFATRPRCVPFFAPPPIRCR